MAEKQMVRVVGLTDKFVVGKTEVTRKGVLLSSEQAKQVEAAAKASGVGIEVQASSETGSGQDAVTAGTTRSGRN